MRSITNTDRVVDLTAHPAYERHDDPERIGRLQCALRRLRHREILELEEWLRVRGLL